MSRLPDLVGKIVGNSDISRGYQIISEISKGGFAGVFKAQSLDTSELVAVKILFPTPKNEREFYQEIAIYNILSSKLSLEDCYKFVVCLYDQFTQNIDGVNYYGLILELIESGEITADIEDVQDLILAGYVEGVDMKTAAELSASEVDVIIADLGRKGLLEVTPNNSLWVVIEDDSIRRNASDMLYYMEMLLEGLAYIHSKNIAHNDVKPENIFVTERNMDGLRVAKYGDFGLSCTDESQPELYGTKYGFIEAINRVKSPFTRQSLQEFNSGTLQKMVVDLDVMTIDPDFLPARSRMVTALLRGSDLGERLFEMNIDTLRDIAHELRAISQDQYAILKCGAQGTPEFISPNYMVPNTDITLELAQKDDVWALGVIFRFMTKGEKIFAFKKLNELVNPTVQMFFATLQESLDLTLVDGKYVIQENKEAMEPVEYISGTPEQNKVITTVIEEMSNVDAIKRPSAQELLDYIRRNV